MTNPPFFIIKKQGRCGHRPLQYFIRNVSRETFLIIELIDFTEKLANAF